MSEVQAARTRESMFKAASSMAGRVAFEADAARQLRRLRRLAGGRRFDDDLRAAVAGKRILVTGASSGVGREAARQLFRSGAEVLVVARRADALTELVDEARAIGQVVHAYPCDLSDQDAAEALAADIIANHGGVDILVNNAGRSIRRTVADSTARAHDYLRVMQLNYFGVLWLTLPLLAQMRCTGGGQIVNVSTLGTQLQGTPRFSAYMSSKAALDQFTRTAAAESAEDGIRWTTVHLPLTRTDMIKPAGAAWHATPSLSLHEGTSMILDAIVRRPSRVSLPVGTVAGAVDRAMTSASTALKGREFRATPKRPTPKVVIVGAGMSAIALAMRLRAAGHDDFTILEKAEALGGTWRDNTYPGLTCDVPAHYYAYVNEPNPRWSKMFAPGHEIRSYLERVATKHDLYRHIRFNTEVVSGEFCDGQWVVTTAAGETLTSEVLVCATGTLHRPKVPDITGLESFGGATFHSSRWDHSARLDGARVAIIGTGSTGAQITSALSTVAAKVLLFQRTPQWVVTVPNPDIPAAVRGALRTVPGLGTSLYTVLRKTFTTLSRGTIEDSWERRTFTMAAHRSLKQVRDPQLRAKLTPRDKPLCKRLIISGQFYQAVQRDTVDVIDTEIDHIAPQGVVTADGRLHEVDVLVLATGFDTQAFMRPMTLTGPTGITLEQAWSKAPRAHNTTMVPGLPNLFLLMGPNSPIGNSSLVPIAEAQADYVVGWLHRMRDRGIAWVEPTQIATERFYERIAAAMAPTIWVSGCDSWYLGPDGVPMLWPWSLEKFKDLLASPDYREFTERSLPTRNVVGPSSRAAEPPTAPATRRVGNA